ncbi:MAG: hypothetical protein ACW968_01305 [Candidatus Thorarchaeota archaeon]|jgi:hypothetical protein
MMTLGRPLYNLIQLLVRMNKSRQRLFDGFLSKRFKGQEVMTKDPWDYMYKKYGRQRSLKDYEKIIGE